MAVKVNGQPQLMDGEPDMEASPAKANALNFLHNFSQDANGALIGS
ncbi:hypothetical protein Bhyg_13250 [Pseudolycoriella hygida]|uniref:Uncharacterized protein n=1 Tax=Pseudolycoriella hygida TaxID=35572 RepID=A0A9Q0RW89_9DIPT|nr:hypothetical protein Bhyg_13250 [Pseudolycoriella hygida]